MENFPEYEVVTRRGVDWVISQPAFARKVLWLPAADAEEWRRLVKENSYGRVWPLLIGIAMLFVVPVAAVLVAGWAYVVQTILVTGVVVLAMMALASWRESVLLRRVESQLRALLPENYEHIPVAKINAWPGPGERSKATHVIMPRS